MPSQKKYKAEVETGENNLRIDKFLQHKFPQFSRNYLQKLFDQELVQVNATYVKPSYKTRIDDKIVFEVPEPAETDMKPEDIALDIVYEDASILVLNKPAGLVVHPGAGVHGGTLVNAIMHHCRDLSGIGGRLRPGIVHRLDKDTSGLMVVAKNDKAHISLSEQFAAKTAYREYLTLVWGDVRPETQQVETKLNRSKRDRTLFVVSDSGKNAITNILVAERFGFATLLSVQLKTGRTHQIRVHMNYLHHPVFGDPDYHGREKMLGQIGKQADRIFMKKMLDQYNRQALHAYKLGLIHPDSGERMNFEKEVPQDFSILLKEIRNYIFKSE